MDLLKIVKKGKSYTGVKFFTSDLFFYHMRSVDGKTFSFENCFSMLLILR